MTSVAQAEFLGLPNGRLASPASLSDLSAELGFVSGDFGTSSYQNIGARVSYRINPDTVIFGDLGASEYGDADGTPMGVGVFYHLARQRISQTADIAAKASYHTGEYKNNGVRIDLSGLSFEVLFSGRKPLTAGGLGWYGNFGFHRITVDLPGNESDSSNEIGIGGGLVLPAGPGEAYVGVDLIDELTFGLGFRYFVQ
jgi:hypothetical protein